MPRLESLLVGGEREDLAGVVLALVRRGVRVAAYRHQRSWVTGLREQAEAAADVHLVETNGYLGLTSEESAEVKRLKRENAELRRANSILKAAAAFFGAELDRPSR